jgi:hypothetical protein
MASFLGDSSRTGRPRFLNSRLLNLCLADKGRPFGPVPLAAAAGWASAAGLSASGTS